MRCIKGEINAVNLQAEEKSCPCSGTKAQMTTRWTCLYELNLMSLNPGWWPLVMPMQNSRVEFKMTGELATKWGIYLGRRERDGSLYFLFCQTYQQLTLKSHAVSQRTSYISSQSLQKTFLCTEWKILPRGILDLLSLRAFKSSLDFLKTRLDKCPSRLAYVVGVLWSGQTKLLMWSSDHLGSLAGLFFNYPVACKCCAGQDDVGPDRTGEVAFVKRIKMMEGWYTSWMPCS